MALPAFAQGTTSVTVDNFVRAETDLYFAGSVGSNGFGKWHHARELMPIGHQTVIRGNRDTLYSSRVFDLDAGPLTVTLPDSGSRFMSLQIISEDHYTSTEYGAGPHMLDKAKVGTRYVMIGIRTFVNPNDPDDMKQAHALQDAISFEQSRDLGKFEVPDWDKDGAKKIRDALLVLASTVSDTRRAFGTKETVDPIQHLIGTASAWGANPPTDAIYLNIVPKQNDGQKIYRLKVQDVPVDGFWSVSVYNAKGYYEQNTANAYTLNTVTAHKEKDGSALVQFGGCESNTPNCLPIVNGWNYMVRLYRPRAEILSGTWKFPDAQSVN